MFLLEALWDAIYGWQLFPLYAAAFIFLLLVVRWADKKARYLKPFRVHLENHDNPKVGDIIKHRGEILFILEYDERTRIAWVTRDLDPPVKRIWKK